MQSIFGWMYAVIVAASKGGILRTVMLTINPFHSTGDPENVELTGLSAGACVPRRLLCLIIRQNCGF